MKWASTALLIVALMFVAAADEKESPRDVPLFEAADGKVELFNGKDLSNFEADPKYWSVQDGEIVGKATENNHPYSYLTTKKGVADFRLVVEVKLTPNEGNSGIQIRSVHVGSEHMKGPQADIGKGWWGHLYEEHERGLLTKKSGEEWVKPNDWNTYEILAVGPKIRTAINGHLCADLNDEKFDRRGILGFQIHSGGPMEVRFRNLRLDLNPKWELSTVKDDGK